jgi:hypothetical protein
MGDDACEGRAIEEGILKSGAECGFNSGSLWLMMLDSKSDVGSVVVVAEFLKVIGQVRRMVHADGHLTTIQSAKIRTTFCLVALEAETTRCRISVPNRTSLTLVSLSSPRALSHLSIRNHGSLRTKLQIPRQAD